MMPPIRIANSHLRSSSLSQNIRGNFNYPSLSHSNSSPEPASWACPLGHSGYAVFPPVQLRFFTVLKSHSRLSGARHIPAEKPGFFSPFYVLQVRSVTGTVLFANHEAIR
jgi:hypothetical protein